MAAAANALTVGPFGGEGGSAWEDSVNTEVRRVVMYTAEVIDLIWVEYTDVKGESTWGDGHGGDGGYRTSINLQYPGEYLICVSGYVSTKDGNQVIHSLTFQSNKARYGPFGTRKGEYFSFPAGLGKIVGFMGRSGQFLNAIGAHIKTHPNVHTAGAFGGQGGQVWDDGIHTAVKKITLTAGDFVDSFSVVYDDDGDQVALGTHGNSGGGKKYPIIFDYQNEYITSVSGYTTRDPNNLFVCSLSIQTNKTTYGPYGTQQGNYFSSSATAAGKIIGFYGRADAYLDSIGVYITKP